MYEIPFIAAYKKVFARSRAFIETILVTLAIFALFVLVPVWTTPGNDVSFQLHLISWPTYVLMGALSVLNGVLIQMQLYLRRHRLVEAGVKQATTFIGILGTSFLSTLACASCYSSLLAFFGLSGTVFIVTNRWWFAAAALALTAFALAHTSRRVMGLCAACEVKARPVFKLW